MTHGFFPFVSVMEMAAQWRTASAKNYSIAFGIFVPSMRRLDSLETTKEKAFKRALAPQQTKWSAEANLGSGKRVENSVPYGS
jgi:hypothetical protein